MYESQIIFVTVVPEFIESIEIHRIAKANSTTHLRRACLYQMIKSALLPNVRLFAFALAAVLEDRLFLLAIVPPRENPALPDRVQGIDDCDRRGEWQVRGVGAFAKIAQQLGLRSAGQRLLR